MISGRTATWVSKLIVLVMAFSPAVMVSGQSPTARGDGGGLPDAVSLSPPSIVPSIGSSPGTLAPSEFSNQDPQIIGGRARGGAGRIPKKLLKTGQVTKPATANAMNPLDLPSALPDSATKPPSDTSLGIPLESFVSDEGPADGLTLDAALARLLTANLDLLALTYEINQADADILTAGLRANPLIYGDTQFIPYGAYNSARPLGPTEYDFSITHPLDLSHKRKSRVDVARAAKSTIEAQFRDAARRQVGNLYRTFVDLQSARIEVMSAQSAVRNQEQVVSRARLGLKDRDEVARLEAQLEKARDALDDAEHSFEDVRDSLGLLLNMTPPEVDKLQPKGTLRNVAPLPNSLEDLTRLALANRPDLVASRRGIGRAQLEVKLARANRFDDVFLFYDPITYQDNRSSHQPSGRSWSTGLTIPLPLYNRNQGNIARAQHNVTQTQVETTAIERRITTEVRVAEREYRSSQQTLRRAEQTILPRAREARIKTLADFAAGKLQLSDYFDRLNEQDDAAKAYREALIRHRRSMLDMNTTLGVRLLP